MSNIDRDELRTYKVKRGTIEECHEVVRLLEELDEDIYVDTSWKRGSTPSPCLYYSPINKYWVGVTVAESIEASEFIDLLKQGSTTPRQTTVELISEYFKTRNKQCIT